MEGAIDYESGVLVTITSPLPGELAEDPEAFYRARASEDVGRSVETVHGTSALVIAPNVEGTGNPGSVSFVIGKVEIKVYGQYAPFTVDELKAIAETVE